MSKVKNVNLDETLQVDVIGITGTDSIFCDVFVSQIAKNTEISYFKQYV